MKNDAVWWQVTGSTARPCTHQLQARVWKDQVSFFKSPVEVQPTLSLERQILYPLYPVACLGFPAPGGKLSFCAPTQPVHGSIDAKNELGIMGRRKLTRALQSPAYIGSRPF